MVLDVGAAAGTGGGGGPWAGVAVAVCLRADLVRLPLVLLVVDSLRQR